MTNHTGLLQHAAFSVPNLLEGYSIDGNARALIAMTLLEELGLAPPTVSKTSRCAISPSCGSPSVRDLGRFRNMLGYDVTGSKMLARRIATHARSGPGTVLGRSSEAGLAGVASSLFERALPTTLAFTSPRAWAFTLLGIHEYLKRFGGDRAAQQTRDELANRLMRQYAAHSTADWPWFEDILAYDNATLPRALLLAGTTWASHATSRPRSPR